MAEGSERRPRPRDLSGLYPFGRRHPAFRHGAAQGRVVSLVEFGVCRGKRGDSTVEDVALPEIGGDRDAVTRARVRLRECRPAPTGVGRKAPWPDALHVDRHLPVPQLADVEVALCAVEVLRTDPAEEDVAGGLGEPLTFNDALCVTRKCASAKQRFEHGGLGLLQL